jgi:WS/DGAT/MGAT family acyltransferase
MIKQLTGLDAFFLYMESSTTFGHVGALSVYERPSPEFDPYTAVRAKVASVIGDLEPLRRRVVEVPLQLDHPYWIEDPDFDLDAHLHRVDLPPPGDEAQLADQIARIAGRRMDRSRPLWEMHVIDGLEGGRWATITKTHHATIDGASGVIMMSLLNDVDPDAPPPGDGTPWEPDRVPDDWELLQRTLRQLAANPVKAVRTQMRLLQQAAVSAGVTRLGDAIGQTRSLLKAVASPSTLQRPHLPHLPLPTSSAPPTPWNRALTAHRSFSMRTTELDHLKALKRATGATVNDVVMAMCAGALREYLLAADALPDKPLRAMVPFSIRTGQEADPWTNRVSALVVDLPTEVEDPLERIARCSEIMGEAKRFFELVPAETLVDITQYSSPILAAAASRVVSQLHLANRVHSPINVVISNVPGPRQPLYFAGSRMERYVPISTVAEGIGLNITVHSYLDRLDLGLIACRELVPDLEDLADLHVEELRRLRAAAGIEAGSSAEAGRA